MKNIETLADFDSEFGTEEQCLHFLTNLRWPNGYRCPRCRHDEAWLLNEKKYKCKYCKYQTTVTAGTVFQDTHLPLTCWFRAVWYISSNAEKATAIGLQKEIGIKSYRTAFLIFQKIKYANAHGNSLKPLQGTVEVGKAFFSIVSCYVNIAVEIKNGKSRYIQASLQEDLNTFIERNIKPQSIILAEGWSGSHILTAKGYGKKSNTYSYSFPYFKKARKKLESFLYEKSNGKKIQDKNLAESLIREFCQKFNAKIVETDFYELLQKMIQVKPITDLSDKK